MQYDTVIRARAARKFLLETCGFPPESVCFLTGCLTSFVTKRCKHPVRKHTDSDRVFDEFCDKTMLKIATNFKKAELKTKIFALRAL